MFPEFLVVHEGLLTVETSISSRRKSLTVFSGEGIGETRGPASQG